MKTFNHATIHTEYHALYAADLFVRLAASDAEQEREMRECMSNRDNYDLEGVRAVVVNWGEVCPNGNAHRVAQAVLAERLAEDASIPTHHVVAGRRFVIAIEFEDTDAGTREANSFMERHPSVGVLEVVGGRVILARQDDNGEPVGPIRRMLCSCCGAVTPGRQWHNRDTGYGLCVACIDYCAKRTEPGEFARTYGNRGVHYDVMPQGSAE